MKNLRVLSPMLMSLLLASIALAQAGTSDAPDAPQPQPSVAAQPEPTPAAATGSSGEDTLISQARRYPRGPRGPMGPRGGYAYPGFPHPPGLSPVGALIGFGLGVAAGATNTGAATVGTHVALGLIGGGLGALIGGAIGAVANPFAHARRVHWPSDPDDEDPGDEDQEADLRRDAHKKHPGPSVTATPAAAPPANSHAAVQAHLDDPAVP